MAAFSVVKDLNVIEDRVGQLDPCLPPLTVQQLDLHRRPEAFHHRVIQPVTDGAEGGHEACLPDLLAEGPGRELGEFNRW